MTELLTLEALAAFAALTALEVVLGIDNVIFIAILAGKLPVEHRDRARTWGLSLAVVSRVLLVLMIGVIMRLDQPWFSLGSVAISAKDLILIAGGLFLLGKATYEIHRKVTHAPDHHGTGTVAATLQAVLLQVLLVDVVFSIDSVITAVGMTEGLAAPIPIMIAAIAVSVAIMLVFSKAITEFIDRHPALKILALAFLLLIGTLLVAEGFHQQISKGYVYFAMAFSLVIELLQMKASRSSHASSKH